MPGNQNIFRKIRNKTRQETARRANQLSRFNNSPCEKYVPNPRGRALALFRLDLLATSKMYRALVQHDAPRELRLRLPVLPVTTRQGVTHMSHAQLVSIFSRGWMTGRAALLAVAVLGLLAAPSRSPAQDAGVSGIPPGPGNARGLNGSVADPSGIGNAARVPAIPPPAISPVPVPTVSSPTATYRSFPAQRAVKMRPTRLAASRSRPSAARAAVREQDKLLNGKIPSICRGC